MLKNLILNFLFWIFLFGKILYFWQHRNFRQTSKNMVKTLEIVNFSIFFCILIWRINKKQKFYMTCEKYVKKVTCKFYLHLVGKMSVQVFNLFVLSIFECLIMSNKLGSTRFSSNEWTENICNILLATLNVSLGCLLDNGRMTSLSAAPDVTSKSAIERIFTRKIKKKI